MLAEMSEQNLKRGSEILENINQSKCLAYLLCAYVIASWVHSLGLAKKSSTKRQVQNIYTDYILDCNMSIRETLIYLQNS